MKQLELMRVSGRVDPSSPVPLYFQVKQVIQRELEDNSSATGVQLPSENQLQAALGVSRVTVRRALSELISDGLLISRRGTGHFVADPTKADVPCLRSFTDDALRGGHLPGAQLLAFQTVVADGHVAEALNCEAGAAVTNVKRLRLLDGAPVFVSDAFMLPSFAVGLHEQSFRRSGKEQSLFRVLREVPGLQLAEGSESVTAVLADPDTAGLFGIADLSPLVQKTCTLRDAYGHTVVHEIATWGVPIVSEVKLKRL